MAICIHITKCYEIDGLHIYHVRNIGADMYEFYVTISAEKQTISFYKNQELKHLLKVIDVNDPNNPIGTPGIPSMIIGCVLTKCLRALRENHFPESMGYYA